MSTPEPLTWIEAVEFGRHASRLVGPDREFLDDLARWLCCHGEPTQLQAARLRRIIARLRGHA